MGGNYQIIKRVSLSTKDTRFNGIPHPPRPADGLSGFNGVLGCSCCCLLFYPAFLADCLNRSSCCNSFNFFLQRFPRVAILVFEQEYAV
jgi:hypothetical protein